VHRRFNDDTLVIASHNEGKVREIGELVQPFGVHVLSAGQLGLPEPEETGDTFAANARLKAESAARRVGLPALSDDSGLCVSALDGKPGIHSARWATPDRDFDKAMREVYRRIKGGDDFSAYFICALALAWPDEHVELFEGRVDGTLVWPPRGDRGFGYDPIFKPEGHDRTFGEMEPAKKHAMSHRAHAFAKLIAACFPDDEDT